jgi:FlaG/FlaF family flagellin (archaellin)
MRRLIIIAATVAALIGGGSVLANAVSDDARLQYVEVTGNGPRLVILGANALKTEDSTRLRLVEYTPDRIVYRVVAP